MTAYNKSQIMTQAHRLYKSNKSMGWSWALRTSWNNAKMTVKAMEVEARNEAIRQMWKEQANDKRAKENEEYNASFVAGPARYYGVGSYNGD